MKRVLICLLIIPLALAAFQSGCANKHETAIDIGEFDWRDERTFVLIFTRGWAQIRAVNGKRIKIGGDYQNCDALEEQMTNANFMQGVPDRYELMVGGLEVLKLWGGDHSSVCGGYVDAKYTSTESQDEREVTFKAIPSSSESKSRKYYVWYLIDKMSKRNFAAVTEGDDPKIIASSDNRVIGRSVYEFHDSISDTPGYEKKILPLN